MIKSIFLAQNIVSNNYENKLVLTFENYTFSQFQFKKLNLQ